MKSGNVLKKLIAITLLTIASKQLAANEVMLNQPIKLCESERSTEACTGCIFGVVDGFEVSNVLNSNLYKDATRICIPDHEPNQRVVDRITNFAKSNLDRMEGKAGSALVAILASLYRCN